MRRGFFFQKPPDACTIRSFPLPSTPSRRNIGYNCIAVRGNFVLGKTISHYKILEKTGLCPLNPMTALRRLIGICLTVATVLSPCLAEMRITFIDAGQADAAVVQIMQPSAEPFTILVDGGDGNSDLEDNLPTILEDDSVIELVVLSHPHRDHVGGLDWLVTESDFQVDQVWWTEEFFSERNYLRLQLGVSQSRIPATRPQEDTHTFTGFSNFSLRVLNNGQEFAGKNGADINDDSLVFQVIYEPAANVRVVALFPGDIEEDQGEMLVTQFGDDLKSDIVKVPHHGSDHVFDEFPEKVAADFAFVSSTGTHGTFKHPRKTALDLYDQTAEIYCTCDEAMTQLDLVVTVSDAGQITVSPQQQPPYFVWEEINGTLQRVVVQ